MKRRQIGIGLIAASVVALVGFGIYRNTLQSKVAGEKVAVAASFYPLAEFARQVGGDKVSVTNITPAGAEPHDYEPTPVQLVTALNSDVFVYNGGTLEPWVDKFVADYRHLALKGSVGIELKGGGDPHYWLDPVMAQRVVQNIEEALAQADPANSGYYAQRAAQYRDRLAALDRAYEDGLKQCRLRAVVTSHEAFSYMASRYRFETLAIAGLDPEAEPSAAKLAELSDVVKNRGIKYVFFESLVSPKLAQTIAQEAGVQTLVLDPIEGISDEDQAAGKNYISVQEENLANLKKALVCE